MHPAKGKAPAAGDIEGIGFLCVGVDGREFERPAEGEAPAAGDIEGIGFLRVGVDGREFERTAVEFKFAET